MHWLAKQNTPVGDIDRNLEASRSPAKVSEHYHKFAGRALGRRIDTAGPRTEFGSGDTHIACVMQV